MLFRSPTVFTNVHNRMRIAPEEIFGPVLVVIPYEDIRVRSLISSECSPQPSAIGHETMRGQLPE